MTHFLQYNDVDRVLVRLSKALNKRVGNGTKIRESPCYLYYKSQI